MSFFVRSPGLCIRDRKSRLVLFSGKTFEMIFEVRRTLLAIAQYPTDYMSLSISGL